MKETNLIVTSGEYSDPRIVAIYDTVNALGNMVDFYQTLAKQIEATSIVDIGCGTGLLTCLFAKAGYEMVGVEPSHEMLNVARGKGCDVRWIEGGVDTLEPLSADLALMTSHVAQFFLDDTEWQDALSSIHQALKPNGYLSFESRPPILSPFSNWPTKETPRHFVDPIAKEISFWLENVTVLDSEKMLVQYELHYHFIENGDELVAVNRLRFRTESQLKQSLVDAGFVVEKVFGDWDSSLLTGESPEMIFVARRR